MKRNTFTIMELLVAMAIMLLFSGLLSRVFISTSQLAKDQLIATDVHMDAKRILDKLSEDIEGIKFHGEPNSNYLNMIGSFYQPSDQNSNTAGILYDSENARGGPWLSFVSSFPEVKFDKTLANAEGSMDEGEIFDGSIGDHKLNAFMGSKEVAYYSIKNKGDEYSTILRAIRSPIASVDTLILNHGQVNKTCGSKYLEKYSIANKVLYFGFEYLKDTIEDGVENYNMESSVWNTKDYPNVVKASISFATSSSEGVLVNGTGTSMNVKKTDGIFPRPSNKTIGFLQIGEGENMGVFRFEQIIKDGDSYTFNGRWAPGSEPVNANPGTSVVIGQTFTRSYYLR